MNFDQKNEIIAAQCQHLRVVDIFFTLKMKLLYLLSDTAAISFLFVIRIGYSSCQRYFRTKWIAHNASCIAYESHGHTMY